MLILDIDYCVYAVCSVKLGIVQDISLPLEIRFNH